MKCLTWDDLADLYKKRTGGRARIQPMETIFNWAEAQPDIQENEDGSLSFIHKIKIKFEGIDSWNRVVFKEIDGYRRYGCVVTLFNFYDTEDKILNTIDEDALCYFGNKFGCEPDGNKPTEPLKIIRKTS